MHGNKLFIKIWSFILALAGVGAVGYILWENGAFLPGWVKWENELFYDQTGQYNILVSNKSVQITYEDVVVFTSPDGVKVQSALLCDMDNDQKEELILLCWKKGRFGTYKPFWVEKDEKKWSQHIFVYEFEQEKVKPKWMSSYIGQEVKELSANGKSAPYSRIWLTDVEGKTSSYRWDVWGFTKEETQASFAVFGDILIHEPIYRYALRHDSSFDFLFDNFRDVIGQSDVAVINQETPYTDDPAMYSDYPRFGTPLLAGQAVADAGFDVVTCATNHALDRGAEGINLTKNFFESHDVVCLGIQTEEEIAERPYEILTRNDIRFALFNYTYGTNGIKIPKENPYMVHLLEDEEKIRKDIERAEKEADIVIVFAHWGSEYASQTEEFQQKWAQIFADSGVDVVIGTHPHVLQPYEVLNGEDGHRMLVFYSIGNFISAQSEKSCVKGGMAQFTISLTPKGYQVTEYALKPLAITWQEDGRFMVDFA